MKFLIKSLLLIPFIVFSNDGLNVIEVSYGDHEKQKIDFYKGSSDKVLIWIHGGGWLYGDKRADRWIQRFQNHFVDHEEFNVFMIGYRIGEGTAPHAVDDVICAYKRIISEITINNLSKEDIIIAGASAGGHLALMLGFSSNYKNKTCLFNTKPKAVINLFGITDLQETSDFLDETKFFKASNYVKRWISKDKSLKEESIYLSPINLVDDDSPAVMTIHGTKDRWVPFNQATLLDKKLKEKHKLLAIEGGGHYFFTDDEDVTIRKNISIFLKDNYSK